MLTPIIHQGQQATEDAGSAAAAVRCDHCAAPSGLGLRWHVRAIPGWDFKPKLPPVCMLMTPALDTRPEGGPQTFMAGATKQNKFPNYE